MNKNWYLFTNYDIPGKIILIYAPSWVESKKELLQFGWDWKSNFQVCSKNVDGFPLKYLVEEFKINLHSLDTVWKGDICMNCFSYFEFVNHSVLIKNCYLCKIDK